MRATCVRCAVRTLHVSIIADGVELVAPSDCYIVRYIVAVTWLCVLSVQAIKAVTSRRNVFQSPDESQ